ncbi:MAG: DUF2200 family protein [Porphyrobacter sp.]|nr:DUF2200 family protein [Porphyrobacter sp.]
MNIRALKFSKIYPMYIRKAKAKGRTKDEVDEVTKGKALLAAWSDCPQSLSREPTCAILAL